MDSTAPLTQPAPVDAPGGAEALLRAASEALLERYLPPGLLVDSTGRVLRAAGQPADCDPLECPGFREALMEALAGGAKPPKVRLTRSGVEEDFLIFAEALPAEPGEAGLFYITFQPASGRPTLPRLAGDTTLELARYAAELERANENLLLHNRHLDEFAYLASHDLKEPLRAILTFSQLLIEDLGGEVPPEAARDLDHITSAAVRMQRLISDLLTLSRAGRADFKRAPIDLRACVDSALEALAARIHETGATITIAALPTVMGDATLLTQLFQNLLSNALKFSHPEPTEPAAIEVTATQGAEGWLFGVRDNGPGIRPEHRESIFQPFRRLHSSREGTGIGLAICRQVVERHGGRIWVEQAQPCGAHFLFTLPLEAEPARRSHA